MAAVKRVGHPSVRKLHAWINGQDENVGNHLAICEYCADRLESLLDESNDSVSQVLLALLSVPEQLPERLRSRIDERLANQRELALIGEFFGLPLRTVRVFASNDQEDDK